MPTQLFLRRRKNVQFTMEMFEKASRTLHDVLMNTHYQIQARKYSRCCESLDDRTLNDIGAIRSDIGRLTYGPDAGSMNHYRNGLPKTSDQP